MVNLDSISDAQIVTHLRAHGMVGHIDREFVAKYRTDTEGGCVMAGLVDSGFTLPIDGDVVEPIRSSCAAIGQRLQEAHDRIVGAPPLDFDAAWDRYRTCLAEQHAVGPDAEGTEAAVNACWEAYEELIQTPAGGQADCFRKAIAIQEQDDFSSLSEVGYFLNELIAVTRRDAERLVAATPAPSEPSERSETTFSEPPVAGWRQRLRASRWAWLEPWYNWGPSCIIAHHDDEPDGDGRFFGFDWLGIHLTVTFGRSPVGARS